METLILGIGNLLMGDEGVGVQVVNHLRAHHELPGVEILDGGTGGFHLLEYFQQYPRVILIDATLDGNPPGTITLLKPKFSSDYPPTLSAHDIGLKDLLDALYLLEQQPEIVLFTISIADISRVSVDLSPEIEAAIPEVVDAIRDYLNKNP